MSVGANISNGSVHRNNILMYIQQDATLLKFTLSLDSGRHPQTYVKPEATITVFELLMMSGVSLETC